LSHLQPRSKHHFQLERSSCEASSNNSALVFCRFDPGFRGGACALFHHQN